MLITVVKSITTFMLIKVHNKDKIIVNYIIRINFMLMKVYNKDETITQRHIQIIHTSPKRSAVAICRAMLSEPSALSPLCHLRTNGENAI